MTTCKLKKSSGMVLVIVACFTALMAVLVVAALNSGANQVLQARRQVQVEQAFYLAEGGAEQAVAYIRNGMPIPGVVTGSYVYSNDHLLGKFTAVVIESFDSGGARASNSISGGVRLNPNKQSDYDFLLVKPDGTTITRYELASDTSSYTNTPCVYYSGPAMMFRVNPKGSGQQNALSLNGGTFPLVNANTYDFLGFGMEVELYNDSRHPSTGKANGEWHLGSIAGNDVSVEVRTGSGTTSDASLRRFTIFSTGRIGSAARAVILEGVQQQSWSRFALWYNKAPGAIWIREGEVFNGPVHANTEIYLDGNPIFNALVSSTASKWGSGSVTNKVQFNGGIWLGAPADTMASVVFSDLKSSAVLVLTGATDVTMSGTNIFVTNSRKGWNKYRLDTPTNGLIYVETATSGTFTSRPGDISVAGNMDGRMTLVAENAIRITNHVTYAVHPTNNSKNALGLIADKDVIVDKSAPKNLEIFAHIIACNPNNSSFTSGFYVENYDTRTGCGALNLYGGLVENNRGAVGTTAGRGYTKNYTYDTRFQAAPPPYYPSVLNIYQWDNWREKAL